MNKTLALLGAAILFAASALAGTIQVPANQPTIQAGINAAVNGDIVLVADGTYYENINFKGKAITVASLFLTDGDTTHINNTVINGSQPSHADSGSVVYFISGEDTTSVLCGFTITGGSGTETTTLWGGTQEPCRAGGGILCYNSGARLLNNKIMDNMVNSPDKKVFGGGLAAFPYGSTAWIILTGNQIKHNTLTANSRSAKGGGVELLCNGKLINNLISFNSVVQNATIEQASEGGLGCRSDETDRRDLIVESNKITHNSVVSYSNQAPAALGGGVLISGSQGRFAKNEVIHNELWVKSDQYGSGSGMEILRVTDTFIIEGNYISKNVVTNGNGFGGGINIATNSSLSFINNIIEGNSASNGGGLIITGNSAAKLINNTVINNQATSGGGINVRGTSTIYLMNSILWGNQASTYAGIQLESGTVKAAYCDIQGGWSGTGNIKADPLFVAGSYQLTDASPCIGKGAAVHDFGGGVVLQTPAADFFGHPRPDPSGSHPDMGAFEHERAFPQRPHLIQVPNDHTTIQAGIDAAVKGDTVLVAEGTYYENINFKSKAITVASHYLMDSDTTHINNTIIDGSRPSDPNKGSVVSFVSGEDTTSVICGFTITGGTGTVSADSRVGGGVYCYSSRSRIVHNKITSNTITYSGAARGGGIGTFPFGNDRYTIIENNIITLNSCIGDERGQGGGIYMPNGKITHNVIRGNSCQGSITALGGGIHGACDQGVRRTLHISHNTIENNHCTNPAASWCRGGGVDAWVVVVYLTDNTIKNNRTHSALKSSGGGVSLWLSNAPSLIQGNTVALNTVDVQGGGIALWYTQGIQVTGNEFKGNYGAQFGGAIYDQATGTVISNNEFRENSTDPNFSAGGGIGCNESKNITITRNLFKGNSALQCGGLAGQNSELLLTNNLFTQNKAQIGGAIGVSQSPQTTLINQIINNTIAENSADTAGGIWLQAGLELLVLNNICWGNHATFSPEMYVQGGELNVAYSDIRFGAEGIKRGAGATVNWLAENKDEDPLLVADSLSNTSPCIGAGTHSYDFGGGTIGSCPETDINGRPRPLPANSNPDMGAWESLLDTLMVGIESLPAANIPQEYALSQNYPNPFNPSTTIEFSLPKSGLVTLKIYNLLGEEVVTLVEEKLAAGRYKINWNATGLANGVYVYRLKADGFVQAKKLILLK